jgi:IS4 transposase
MDEIPYESGSYYIFDRGYNDYKRLYTIHQICAYFVIRAKTNLHYNTEKWKRRMPDNVLSDQMITLSGYYSQKKYPEPIRKVIYWDEEQDREFVYLTNATEITALQVANLYKNRWQVELFFKWLKQHLRIKKFWGTNENAVRIQIYSAITAYCMVAIVQHDLHIGKSIYDVLQILDRNLTHKILLPELFDKSKIKNFKDQIGPSEPNLFNF